MPASRSAAQLHQHSMADKHSHHVEPDVAGPRDSLLAHVLARADLDRASQCSRVVLTARVPSHDINENALKGFHAAVVLASSVGTADSSASVCTARRIHAGGAEALVARGGSHRHPVGLPLLLGVPVGGEGHRGWLPCQPASSRYRYRLQQQHQEGLFLHAPCQHMQQPRAVDMGDHSVTTILVSPRSLASSL